MSENAYSPLGKLEAPMDFQFPHTPYKIQQQLMASLFMVLEQKQVGIFESPTGTGKSLTLTCGALRWLEMHEELVKRELHERIADMQKELRDLDKEGALATDWLNAQSTARVQRTELSDLESMKRLLDEQEEQLKELRRDRTQKKPQAAQKPTGNATNNAHQDEQSSKEKDLELEDVDCLNSSDDTHSEELNQSTERYRSTQIFFCSRTHSQLAQVLNEVKRTAYGQRVRCISLASRQQLCINPQVRRLPTATAINERCLEMARSRKRTGDTSKITALDADGCAKKKSRVIGNRAASTCACSFKAPQAMRQLTDNALMDILDIEELVAEGETIQACPYYAIRQSVPLAQLVMLPYQLLLHRRTRKQSGIDLRGAVVIIDEAHNLLDTIAQLHSCELTLVQSRQLHQQLTAYKQQYASRFGATNLLRLNQLLYVIKCLNTLASAGDDKKPTRMLRTYELTAEGEFFNIDLFQLLEFCERSRLAQKLQGFVQRSQQLGPNESNENTPPPKPTTTKSAQSTAAKQLLERLQKQHHDRGASKKSKATNTKEDATKHGVEDGSTETIRHTQSPTTPTTTTSCHIRSLLAFIESLTESAEDGRVLLTVDDEKTAKDKSVTNTGNKAGYKYLLLNPGSHFAEVIRDARAIVIAGGTMQPTAELTQQLFPACIERVHEYFYDHVVSAAAVLPLLVSRGPTGRQLCFNYAQRNSVEMLTELGNCLLNVCNVVPAGVVCFFPSYDYLETVYIHLERSGLLQRIATRKRIFREPRAAVITSTAKVTDGSVASVEQLLADYGSAIKRGIEGGALMLSVVGGKLSEGLNFADDLGRAVVVVGLPYPNRNSAELQERLRYLDATIGAGAGNEYYENLCMKAVNQCIGRSVRHISDYACVCLLDERYAGERVRQKLPQWIARSVQQPAHFGAMQAAIVRFFKDKRIVLSEISNLS